MKVAVSNTSRQGVAWTPELEAVFRYRYGGPEVAGPGPRLRRRWGYASPDDHYEALVARLVQPSCDWLDVGCGKSVFPCNPRLARELADRCGFLLGIDPDPTIQENNIVHQKRQTTVEELHVEQTFDLITLRMVAEHLERPEATIAALGRLCKAGGRVVVYTVNRWSPTALAARIVPFGIHHPIKRLLWQTNSEDTFPVAYRMNTRRQLRRQFAAGGFSEDSFDYLDDCRCFYCFDMLHRADLLFWRFCRAAGIPYPETCLLGVYRRP